MNNNFNSLTPEGERLLKTNGIDINNLSKEQMNKILAKLSPADTKKINDLLSDQKALEAVLNSGKAKAILKMLMGNSGAK